MRNPAKPPQKQHPQICKAPASPHRDGHPPPASFIPPAYGTAPFVPAVHGPVRLAPLFTPHVPGATNPFIDPAGYHAYIANREAAYRKELARQQAAAKP